jgi:cob(I)alamin adenosyltransferase
VQAVAERYVVRKSGLLMAFVGDRAGTTASALGLVFRAIGRGLKVCVMHFDNDSSMYVTPDCAEHFRDLLTIHAPGKKITYKPGDRANDLAAARDALQAAGELIRSGNFNVVVLDGITSLVASGLVDESEMIDFLAAASVKGHLVVTGPDAMQSLIQAADLVTEVREPGDYQGSKRKKRINTESS